MTIFWIIALIIFICILGGVSSVKKTPSVSVSMSGSGRTSTKTVVKDVYIDPRIFRIGYGCDIHRLAEGRPLYLCGCLIPYEKGLLGHSDADAAVHALIDAMIGALALGDIGHFFPDTDPKYKDASGEFLLKQTLAHPSFQSWELGNADITIIAQAPKMAPHIQTMRLRLAELLNTDIGNISVKAKTAEKLDSVGEGLAIEVRCVVMMFRKDGKVNIKH